MKLYRITRPAAIASATAMPTVAYAGYLTGDGGAHAYAKSTPKPYWGDVFIDEMDVMSDKAAIIAYLNGSDPIPVPAEGDAKPMRSWTLTSRGGLQETEAP